MVDTSTKRNEIPSINHPQKDLRCYCCNRLANELEPSGKAGDPLVGDFEGALLVKTYRTAVPDPDTEILEIYERFFGNCNTAADYDGAERLLAREYGEEDAHNIMCWVHGASQVSSSLECRDCAVLDMDEFFKKLGYDLKKYREWRPRRIVEKGSHARG